MASLKSERNFFFMATSTNKC